VLSINTQKINQLALFSLIVIAVVYAPMLSVWLQSGIEGAFGYFAADAFYYLSVADHSVGKSFYTFDGQFPTNGFHPLWQYYLCISFELFKIQAAESQVLFTFFSSILFVAIGTGLFGLALNRITKNLAVTLISLVPGLFGILFAHISLEGTSPNNQWSFINGMETPLSILFFGVLTYFLICKKYLVQVSLKKVAVVSLLLTLITLSRLDDIFMFAPFFLLLFILSDNRKTILKNLVAFAVIPFLLIGTYILYNLSYAGVALPTSGIAKAGLTYRNLKLLVGLFIPKLQFVAIGTDFWGELRYRLLQMSVPMFLSVAWVGRQILTFRSENKSKAANSVSRTGIRDYFLKNDFRYNMMIITAFSIYVFLKGAYNFLNVHVWGQGHWYFALSLMICNMIMALFLSKIFEAVKIKHKFVRLGVIAFAMTYIVLLANDFTDIKMKDSYRKNKRLEFWLARNDVMQNVGEIINGYGLLSFDDGIISYSLKGIPTMNGLGLALDKEAFEHIQKGNLFRIAYQRGFRFFTGLYSFDIPKEADTNPEVLKTDRFVGWYHLDQYRKQWDFSVAYRHPETNVAFVEFKPAQSLSEPLTNGSLTN